jgi:Fur family transcriptional regulator, peroxide stress response regulator
MQRAARKRTTRQLEQVFKALQGDHTHPFAHQIYQRVHKKLPHISLATVYRNLHSLVEAGKIRSLLLDEQAARYDPETSEHDHFICERCGRVIDLFLKRVRRIDLTRLAKDGYVVTTHNLTVYGLCQVCARRRRTSRLSRARLESPRQNRGVSTLAVTRE